MKFKKVIFLTLLLVIILTMGSVSASEDNATSETLAVDDNDDLEINQDEMIQINDDSEALPYSLGDFGNGSVSVKKDPEMSVNCTPEVYAGEDVMVVVGLSENATGNVSADVNGDVFSTTIESGFALIQISGLGVGSYNATVSYPGDGNYSSAAKVISFNVISRVPEMSVNCTPEVYAGEDVMVVVGLPDDATGIVTVTVNGVNKVGSIVSGKSSITFSGLSIGNYNVHVAYDGDANYASASADTSFSVTAPTFENLQSEIDALSPGETFTLTRDYESTGTSISISNSITIDGDGHTLDAKGLSSIFEITAADCTLKNLILTNAVGNGSGAIRVDGDNFNILNTEISNSASYIGAAIYSMGKDGVYDNITVINTTSMDEGAVYLYEQGNTISYSTFINCYGNAASALYIRGDANSITSCAFINSSSTEDAGAVFIDASMCMIMNSIFENNIAGGNGGAIYWRGNGGIIMNTNFINNRAENKGEATSKGGALYIAGSDINITSSTFTFNESESNILNGGAIYVAGNEVNIYDLTFTGSTAVNGGSVYWTGDDGRVMMSEFYNSTASANGGAVYWQGNNGVIEGCEFENCTAVNGGAVYGLNTTVSNSNFTNNIASGNGSAMYNCSFEDCGFESNTDPIVYPFKRNITIAIWASDVYVGEDLIVNIILSENVTGNVTIIFDDINANATVIDGNGSFHILTAKGGSFEIKAIFEGNNDYLPTNTTMMVNVMKYDADIHVDLVDERIISIELPDDSTANLIFMIEDLSVVRNESTVLNVSVLSAGDYDYFINYTGDDKYNAYAAYNSITLPKRSISLTILTSDDEYTVEEDIIGEIHLSSLINASLTLELDNKSYIVHAVNGTAIFNIASRRGGDFNLTATFYGDDEYVGVSNVTALRIIKLSLPVSVDFDDDNRIISVALPADFTGNVNFSIGDMNLDLNESAVINLTDFVPGSYAYTIYYAGDDKYLPYSDSGSVNVPKFDAVIAISADDVSVGEDITVNVTLPGDVSGFVILVFDGANYTVDVVDGSASYNLSATHSGEFNITVIFMGDDKYLGANSTIPVTVNKTELTVTVDFDGDNRIISVGLPADLADNADLIIDGKLIFSNSVSGVVNVSNLMPGSHVYSISYAGDDKYLPYSDSGSVNVPKFDAVIEISAFGARVGEDVTVNVTLPGDVSGFVILVFDGANYTVDVVDGSASYNLSATHSGEFNITVIFMGDYKYLGANSTIPVTVNKTELTVTVDFDEDNRIISVALPADLAGNVNFRIGDMNLDLYGSAVINLTDFVPGSYAYTIDYAGDDKYLPYSNSSSINVPKFDAVISITVADVSVGEDIIINISLPSDVSGMVTLVFDGNNYNSGVVDGLVSYSIPATHSGEFNITVIFMGNEKYSMANITEAVTVNKVTPTVNVVFDENNRTISVTLPQDITGNASFIIGDINRDLNESTVISLTDFIPGNYTYTIDYAGDDKYLPYSDSGSIRVPKKDPDMEILALNPRYGESQNVTLNFPVDAEGNVTFTLIDEKTSEIIERVNAKVGDVYSIPNLNVGIYRLQANYTGDIKYSQELKEVSFKVSPNLSIIPEVYVGEDGLITMELGNVTGSIGVSVDGEFYGSSKISAGKFRYYIPTDELIAGNHSVTFGCIQTSFNENVFNYWDNNTNSYKPIEYLLKVNHKPTTTVSDSDNDKLLEVKIEDSEGKVLTNATGEVVFTILDQLTNQYTEVVVSVVNGIAKLDISKFKDGNYQITWNYLGDAQHAPISKELTLKVTHKASRIAAGDLTLLYTTSKTYSVTVYSAGGQALSGMSVSFLINNKVVKTTTTNAKGVASIVISQVPGSYKLTAKSGSASVTKKLTVTHLVSLKSVKVKKSAKKLVLQATLKKVNGKYLKNKKVTFKFNGKKLTGKTNKKGVAKVTVKSNVLKKLKTGKKVTYQATYLKDTVKKSVKVKK